MSFQPQRNMCGPAPLHSNANIRNYLDENRYDPGYGMINVGQERFLSKLRSLSNKEDIDVYKLFEPFDHEGNGKVNVKDFIGAVEESILYYAGMTHTEMDRLLFTYTDRSTGQVDYLAFADFIHKPDRKHYDSRMSTVRTQDFENKRYSNTADELEVQYLNNLIDHIAFVSIHKRIHIEPFISEFGTYTQNRGILTIPQLSRVFYKLGIILNETDFSLICKWFGFHGNLINVGLFFQAISRASSQVKSGKIYDSKLVAKFGGRGPFRAELTKCIRPDFRGIDLKHLFQHCDSSHPGQNIWNYMHEDVTDVIKRIQKTVHSKQIFLRPQFKQFDPLNSGSCTVEQFRRGLEACGINVVGNCTVPLNASELDDLVRLYTNPHQTNMIMWRKFVSDIETVSCIRELNRYPSANINDCGPKGPPKDVLFLPCKYARRKEMTEVERRRGERAIEFVRNQMQGVGLYNLFRMFDKKYKGHITRVQFRDVLAMSKIFLRESDICDLEQYFIDYNGFCYVSFLQMIGEIQPEPGSLPPTHVEKIRVQPTNIGDSIPYETEGKNAEEVMTKIKNVLPPTHVEKIRVQPTNIGDSIPYETEGKNAEEVMTKIKNVLPPTHVEKIRVQPTNIGDSIPYETEGKNAEEVMTKIKNVLFQRSLSLKDFFEGFDFHRSGVLSREKFIQALVSVYDWAFTFKEYNLLMDAFSTEFDRDRVNYRQFVEGINEIYTQKNLERTPLVVPIPFQGCREERKLSDKQRKYIGHAMLKLTPYRYSMLDIRLFSTLDKFQRGTVSYANFLKGLDSLGALRWISVADRALIFSAFSKPVGRIYEFDYKEFLRACHLMYSSRYDEQRL